MGDQPMIKKILLATPFVFVVGTYADLSVKQIENMVHKIHLKREGADLKTLEKTKEPFVHIQKENNTTVVVTAVKPVEEVKLSLHALMAGKAYINDGWKKVDDTIMGYKVVYIGKQGVVLKNGNNIKKLFLKKSKNNLIKLK